MFRSCLAPLIATIFMLGSPLATAQSRPVSGTVTISQVTFALMWSANLGGGTLTFQGRTHDFVIGGLGIGGVGASAFKATGQVYGLRNASDFEGVFGQTRSGYVVGEKGKGKLWLENNNGVVLALTPERKGLALSLGADGVVVKFK